MKSLTEEYKYEWKKEMTIQCGAISEQGDEQNTRIWICLKKNSFIIRTSNTKLDDTQ